MILRHDFSEDDISEQPAIALFEEMNWNIENCYCERFSSGASIGEIPRDVALLAVDHTQVLEGHLIYLSASSFIKNYIY